MKKEIMRKNRSIQVEQKQLLLIQKEVDDLIVKVDEAINALKVEELQLRSSAASSEIPSSSSSLISSNKTPSTTKTLYSLDMLNNASKWTKEHAEEESFELDLNTFTNPRPDVEEDDDE